MKNTTSLLFFLFSFYLAFSQVPIGFIIKTGPSLLENANGNATSLSQEAKANGLIVVFSCNTCPFVVGSPNFPGWEEQYDGLKSLAEQNEIGFVLINSNEAKRNGADSFEEMEKHDGKPLGIVNCLNFGHPKDSIYDFSTFITELTHKCKQYKLPVIGGNVSLYNATDNVSIKPTPILVFIGIV